MNWTRMGEYWLQSDHDYIVSKSGTGDGWIYSAWTPRIADGQYRAMIKAHYTICDPIPQWRELIGAYPDAKAAQLSCDRHHKQAV